MMKLLEFDLLTLAFLAAGVAAAATLADPAGAAPRNAVRINAKTANPNSFFTMTSSLGPEITRDGSHGEKGPLRRCRPARKVGLSRRPPLDKPGRPPA
jgi:hypothetical protein